jgi:required for meiotic nuclear division protein 1
MTKPEVISVEPGTRVTAHALNVGDRINTMGFEGETLSAVPLAVRVGKTGVAVLFRYGVVVLIGVSLQDESGFLEKLTPRIGGKRERFEEETATVVVAGEIEDQVQAGGPIQLRDMSPERLLVISDVLAKSVELAHDEREVTKVFEIIEPFTKELADHGRTRRNRKGMLKLLGNARREEEEEWRARFTPLNRKLAVIAETANTLADIIDARRSLRLELIVVVLIAFEVAITSYQIYAARGH